jgi:hypothetical protein
VTARVKGLGLTEVKFKCDRIAEALRPGRRIVIMRPTEEDARRRVPAKATIIHTGAFELRKLRFRCVVDPSETADKYRWRKPMNHNRIVRFLDEPDRKICGCGYIIHDGKADTGAKDITCRDALGEAGSALASRMGIGICDDLPF